ncbi:hypothetical protein NN561_009808 [Cricetulus griseus]
MAQGSGLLSGRDPCCLAYSSVAHSTARVPPCSGNVQGPRRGTKMQGPGAQVTLRSPPRSCRLAQGGARHLNPHHGELCHSRFGRPIALSHPGKHTPLAPLTLHGALKPLGGGSDVPGDRGRPPTKGSALQSCSASTQPLRVEPDLAEPEKRSPPTCTSRHQVGWTASMRMRRGACSTHA